MKISVITLFPKMIEGFFNESIIKRAIDKKLVEIEIINLRDFAINDYGSVDERPYGGGAGMVIRADVVHKAILQISNSKLKRRIVLTSAKGKQFDQKKAISFSKLKNLVIIAGHYEGFDERINNDIDEEVSLGDFVMTGGEITAAGIMDAVVRLIPGVLKKDSATKLESFFEVSIDELMKVINNELLKTLHDKGVKKIKLLEYPQYTRPEEYDGKKVPKVLLSGNHKDIEEWRLKMAFEETLKKRKDLLTK